MSKTHSTPSAKPSKPYPEFPLFPHATRRWAKKIRGKMHYFGPWSDPDGALAKYLAERDALHAGRKPRPDIDGVTVKDACNAFLNNRKARLDSGELSPRTWIKYKEVCDLLVSSLGKSRLVADLDPEDFATLRNKLAKRWGALRLGDFIQHFRSVFKHALEAGLIDKPVRFGPGFARPSKKTIRLERAKKGLCMFESAEIREMVEGTLVVGTEGPQLVCAGSPLKAMILLGVNAGFGNADCGTLPLTALDLERGWLNYARPKTGIARRCPLWPETVAAVREALDHRQEPKRPEDAGLVFVTNKGESWRKDTEDNPVSKEMRKLLDGLGINGQRNFYALRHTFETIGGEAKDQVAVDAIMGHARDDMASLYRERISDARLRAVADHVRAWLFAKPDKKAQEPGQAREEGSRQAM